MLEHRNPATDNRGVDPLLAAAGLGVIGPLIAGPAVAHGLGFLPGEWRRTAEWLLIGAAAAFAIAAERLGLGAGVAQVSLLAALPGVIAFLVSRSLLASTLVSLVPFYLVIGELTRGMPAYTPVTRLDLAIPLRPSWMLVYGSLWVFAVILPLVLVRQPDLGRRALTAYLAVMVTAYLGFFFYPTLAPRPAVVPGDEFSAWTLRLTYSIDPPHGCFPSLHVAYSFLSALICWRIHRGVGAAALTWAAMIGASTLFTKQHYFVDVVAGALLAWVAYVALISGLPRERIPEADRRRAPLRALGVAALFGSMVAAVWLVFLLG